MGKIRNSYKMLVSPGRKGYPFDLGTEKRIILKPLFKK
jgi:hypothetical protein